MRTCVIATVAVVLAASLPARAPFPQLKGDGRLEAIPKASVKMTPATDAHPPIMHSRGWTDPEPMSSAINTAGGEDSPFVTPDGKTFYFWFTPDVSVPAEKQLFDGVTGIWVSRRTADGWSRAERVLLQDRGKLALDGAPTVRGSTLWFCSAREGYTGLRWFTARIGAARWSDWQYAGDQLCIEYDAGELHLTPDGQLYFHSARPGGKGGLDLWVTRRTGGAWSAPVNVPDVNTPEDESRPFVSEDGRELWFTRTLRGAPAVFRCTRSGSRWSPSELIVSQFAGEPSLDRAGNLYFAHHFFRDSKMIEADIYVAHKRR